MAWVNNITEAPQDLWAICRWVKDNSTHMVQDTTEGESIYLCFTFLLNVAIEFITAMKTLLKSDEVLIFSSFAVILTF